MSKITRRLATATATLAAAGGIIFAAGGAASAATYESDSHTATVATRQEVVKVVSRSWDGHRWWSRYSKDGSLYLSIQGHRYRYDGHHFYQWSHGKWRRLTSASIRHLGFDHRHFSGHHGHHVDHGNSGHHGDSGHGNSGDHGHGR
ncbi:hypothetical protein AB0M44_02455 [Streptosporangium subroseum]|uniref:hypothetical protein n=1 Tax=Streptosporangium subroseum TaxID=106412 RepID=UPI003448E3EE